MSLLHKDKQLIGAAGEVEDVEFYRYSIDFKLAMINR